MEREVRFNHSEFDTRPLPSESRLIRYLLEADLEIGSEVVITDSADPICGVIERFIGDCLMHVSKRVYWRWWSDGVPLVTLSRVSERTHLLAGVSCSGGRMPFELEATIAESNMDRFDKIILRIGSRCGRVRPDVTDEQILSDRPQANKDWAVAVELKPET